MKPFHFDYDGAKKAGYTNDEIAIFLGEKAGYDSSAALESGLPSEEIIDFIQRGGGPPDKGTFTNLTVNRLTSGTIRLPGQLASGAAATMRAIEDPVIDKQPTEQEYYEAGIPVSTITNKPMATFVPREKSSPAHYEIDKEAFGGGRWTNIDKATGSPGVLNNIISAVTKEQLPTRQDVQAFYDDVKAKTSDLPDPESAKKIYQYLLANEGETAATEYRNLFKQKLMEALPPEEHKDSDMLKFLDHLAKGLTESGEQFIYEHPSIDMPREISSLHGVKDAWEQGKFMKWALANSMENLPQMATNMGVIAASSLFGTPALGAVISSGMMYSLETGGVYQDLIKQGVPPKYAADVAPMVGIINAALEVVPVESLVSYGSGSIIKKLIGKKLTKYLVENPTFTKKLIDKTLGIGFQGIEEGETEKWQEVVSNAAQAVYNENQDLFKGATEAQVVGLVMGLFGATGETVHSTLKERGAAGKVEDENNASEAPSTNEKDTSLLPVGSPDREDQSYIGDIPAVVNPMSSGSPNREGQSPLGDITAPGNEVPPTDWREELRKAREGDGVDTTGADEGQTKGGEENLTPEQKMREELISSNFDPDFIENKVAELGSLEAVHDVYPDDSTLVRAYARRFAENLYGKGENKDVEAEENKPETGSEEEAGTKGEAEAINDFEKAVQDFKENGDIIRLNKAVGAHQSRYIRKQISNGEPISLQEAVKYEQKEKEQLKKKREYAFSEEGEQEAEDKHQQRIKEKQAEDERINRDISEKGKDRIASLQDNESYGFEGMGGGFSIQKNSDGSIIVSILNDKNEKVKVLGKIDENGIIRDADLRGFVLGLIDGTYKRVQPETSPQTEDVAVVAKGEGKEESKGDAEEKKEKINRAINTPWLLTSDELVTTVAETLEVNPNDKIGSGTGTYEDAWRRDHRLAVEHAVKNGKSVPENVLAEYPDLQSTTTDAFNPLNILTSGEKNPAASDHVKSSSGEQVEDTPTETKLKQFKSELEAEIKDWASRKYKSNSRVVPVGGTFDDLNAGTTTIGSANERRRRSNIESRQIAIREIDDVLERIKKDPQAINDLLDSSYVPAVKLAEQLTKEAPQNEEETIKAGEPAQATGTEGLDSGSEEQQKVDQSEENPHGLVTPIENIPADMEVMTSVVGEESGRQAVTLVKAREAVKALGDLIEKLNKILDCVKS